MIAENQKIPNITSLLCTDHSRLRYHSSNGLYHQFNYKGQILLISYSKKQNNFAKSMNYLQHMEQGHSDFRNNFPILISSKINCSRAELLFEGYSTSFKDMKQFDRSNNFLNNEDYLMRWWKKCKEMFNNNVLCQNLKEQNLIVNFNGDHLLLGFAKYEKQSPETIRQVKQQNLKFFLKQFQQAKKIEIIKQIQEMIKNI